MVDISHNTYIFTLYPLIIITTLSILGIIRLVRNTDFPVEIPSLKIFIAYLLCGLVGWTGLWLQELGLTEPNLHESTFFYLLCGFLLFLVSHDYNPQKHLKYAVAAIHLVVLVASQMAESTYEIMQIISWYIFILYPVIAYFFIKKTIIHKNIGHLIIAFAVLIDPVMAAIELYELYTHRDAILVYQLAFTAASIGYIIVAIGFLTTILINEHQNLLNMSLNDPLTKVLNRRGLNVSLTAIIEMNKRKQTSLSVLFINLNNFKAINKKHGRSGGDEILRMFAENLQQSTRKGDLLCRLGSDEFILVMPETCIELAQIATNRIQQHVNECSLQYQAEIINLKAGFGISNDYGDINFDDLIQQAHQAAQQSKLNDHNIQISDNAVYPAISKQVAKA